MTELDQALALLRGDFIARLAAEKSRLDLSEAREDWAEVAAIAHKLAGAAGLFGFPEISANAVDLEQAINDALPNKIRIARQQALTTLMAELIHAA